MKNYNSSILLIFLIALISCTPSQKEAPNDDPGFSIPETEGIASRAILEFVEALERDFPDEIHSMMLQRHGKIVAQAWWTPFNQDSPHMLYSLSKSFTSTAIGMAQEEGLLSINDPVISFFPGETPEEPGDHLKAMRIRDLLKMNSGHQWGTISGMREGASWVEGFLALEVQHKPGTHFVYNSGATYMLSAIIQKLTGLTLLDYLTPRLFEPLGIENPSWESDPEGINMGGWGLSVKTEDISKLGQLYLQKGVWKGTRIIPEAWVEEATKLQTSNGSNPESDWEQGYGYQFWRCRHNIYRGDGAFGQFCIVMPEQDAVLAITSGTYDMQGIMNLVWEHLLPAFSENSLPADIEEENLLNEKLSDLSISAVQGEANSPEASPHVVTITSEEGVQSFKAGYGTMEIGLLKNPQLFSQKIAVSGAWEAPETYGVNLIYYESPHSVKYTFQFNERSLLWDTDLNVSFGPRKLEQLKGKKAPG